MLEVGVEGDKKVVESVVCATVVTSTEVDGLVDTSRLVKEA